MKSVMMINRVLFQLSFKFGGVNFTDRLIWMSGTAKLADRSFNLVLEWATSERART